ncbi:hypothetical protein [Actinotalea subterranea]|uniref:hypothetical protein n=1 Tax=Actinotalea subterranea TaxID=2607497 RepID=UPI0011ED1089|nr:hypothetical protein [Actinotalea subterranea]
MNASEDAGRQAAAGPGTTTPGPPSRRAAHRPAATRSARPRPTRALAASAVLLAGLALTACTSVNTDEERAAQDLVLGLLNRTAMSSYTQDINGFARAADGADGSGTRLIAIDASTDGDVLGRLTFAVSLDDAMYTQGTGGFFQPSADDWDPGPYCFRVTFDAYGKIGEFGTADGVDMVPCPDDTTAITPPPSTDPLLAPESRDAAHSILTALPTTQEPDTDAIAAQINALLPAEVDGRPAFQATVALDGSDIGVALGFGSDCVLVARLDGAVTDVYPPDIYLQPGELGCGPDTALIRDLRPPH